MRGLLLILFVLLCSCNYFENKKLSKDEILNEELQTINWNDVDEYPSFASCDSTSLKKQRRACFENTLRTNVMQSLSEHSFIVSEEIDETLSLTIHIEKTGYVYIKEISMPDNIKQNIPELDSLLQLSIKSLPQVYPAIKRSQQVDTEFKLPIEIKINE